MLVNRTISRWLAAMGIICSVGNPRTAESRSTTYNSSKQLRWASGGSSDTYRGFEGKHDRCLIECFDINISNNLLECRGDISQDLRTQRKIREEAFLDWPVEGACIDEIADHVGP
jgi:hypothetical protein